MTNIDAKAVASSLGIESRVLRRFLRSDVSSFTPVGTGKQYSFEEKDLSTLEEEFKTWKAGGRGTRKTVTQKEISKNHPSLNVNLTDTEADEALSSPSPKQSDLEVWAEDEWTTARIDAALLRYRRDPAYRAEVARKDREATQKLIAACRAAELRAIKEA